MNLQLYPRDRDREPCIDLVILKMVWKENGRTRTVSRTSSTTCKHTHQVVAISGSASRPSRTGKVAEHALNSLPDNVRSSIIHLSTLPHTPLLAGDMKNRDLCAAADMIATADGVVFATPIYKASLSGISKAFLDALPQYAFAGKVVWPLATGGSIAHSLALDYGIRPIIQSMGARQIIQSCFLTTDQINAACETELAEKLNSFQRFREAIFHFLCALNSEPPATLLGHPIPERKTPGVRDAPYKT